MTDVGCAETLAQIAGLLLDGSVTLPPVKVYALQDAAEAHRQVESGHTRGKLVLKVAEL